MPPRALKTAPFDRERQLWDEGKLHVAGTDEVGRGCLAGPVVAVAVVFPPHMEAIPGVYDSKVVSQSRREALLETIYATAAVGVGICTPQEIDNINIREASLLAMTKAVEALPRVPDVVLVDGNVLPPSLPCPGETLVKGDSRSHSIAAASIVAKVIRDRMMVELAMKTEGFHSWESNKGYPAPAHYAAIEEFGLTPHHRRSFKCTRK